MYNSQNKFLSQVTRKLDETRMRTYKGIMLKLNLVITV